MVVVAGGGTSLLVQPFFFVPRRNFFRLFHFPFRYIGNPPLYPVTTVFANSTLPFCILFFFVSNRSFARSPGVSHIPWIRRLPAIYRRSSVKQRRNNAIRPGTLLPSLAIKKKTKYIILDKKYEKIREEDDNHDSILRFTQVKVFEEFHCEIR